MRKQKGFSLIELLIVVAIILIIAAIAIPNLLTAMQRSKQKRSMADMRAIATAWEARATDANTYGSSGTSFAWLASEITFNGLFGILTPTYIKALPQNDGWTRPFGFSMDKAIGVANAAQAYAIRSAGKDGSFQAATYTIGTGTTIFDCDIVYTNGSFVQWPEGMQTQ